ncbi:MAG: cation diffusion facilitator family transporter [Chitinophagales bacterium]
MADRATGCVEDWERYRAIRRVLWLILVLNWAVAVAKVAFGQWSHTASMTADGYHSLGDGASNIIGLVGLWAAARPADESHPYGHKKYETFTALGIAGLLVLVSLDILQSVAGRLFRPGAALPRVTTASFLVMLVTLAVNVAVMTYERRQGRMLKSDLLVSDALHTMSDVYVSLSVVATLIAVRLGFPWFDVVAALVIAAVILRSAWGIVRHSSDVLCDAMVLDSRRVAEVVTKVPGVRSCHRIVSRGREDDLEVHLHVQVDPRMPAREAHDLSHRIEQAVRRAFPGVSRVISHVEPFEGPGRNPPES